MSPADLSLFVFGIYVIVVDGIGLMAIPNAILKRFGLSETKEVWIRILGFILVLLGAYYVVGGVYHLTPFAWATVFARCAVLMFFIVMTLLKQTKPAIILFGIVDTAGALWTLIALLRAT
jgi:hypothetical protein